MTVQTVHRSFFDDKVILITGGTGSFGKKFIENTLEKFNPRQLIVFSRDEMKQWDLRTSAGNDSRLSFRIGDIRDKEQLMDCLVGVDLVVHAAATKIVPTSEANPFECIKTNVFGSMNVIDACKRSGVQKVVALSTDKACNPINLYGATKLTADKLFTVGAHLDNCATKYAVVRYGNVMGSRGSVIPFFMKLARQGKPLPITDPTMTRFMISLDEAVNLVWQAFSEMSGGEIFVKKLPSMNILSIARSVYPEAKFEIIGIRPGEKLHEQMISEDDAPFTFELQDHFVILRDRAEARLFEKKDITAIKVEQGFRYSSETNDFWMSEIELSDFLQKNASDFDVG